METISKMKIKKLAEFYLITSHHDSHTTTDIKPEIIPGVQTENGIPHDKYNIRGIAHVRKNRKDNTFRQRRLYIDEAHTGSDIFRSHGHNKDMYRARILAWASGRMVHRLWPYCGRHFFNFLSESKSIVFYMYSGIVKYTWRCVFFFKIYKIFVAWLLSF